MFERKLHTTTNNPNNPNTIHTDNSSSNRWWTYYFNNGNRTIAFLYLLGAVCFATLFVVLWKIHTTGGNIDYYINYMDSMEKTNDNSQSNGDGTATDVICRNGIQSLLNGTYSCLFVFRVPPVF